MSDKICVTFPIHQGSIEWQVKEALDSMVEQSEPSFYVYVVLDGPVDEKILDLVQTYDKLLRIRISSFSENMGLAKALNHIIRNSSAEYIARMDTDDISLSDRLSKQKLFMDSNQDIDVCGGQIIERFEDLGEARRDYPIKHDSCYSEFAYRDPINHPSAFFRRSFFDKSGLYNENMTKDQDTEIWFRGFNNDCKFSNIPELVLIHRRNPMQSRRRSSLKRLWEYVILRLKINYSLRYGLKAYLYLLCYAFSYAVSAKYAYFVYRKYINKRT